MPAKPVAEHIGHLFPLGFFILHTVKLVYNGHSKIDKTKVYSTRISYIVPDKSDSDVMFCL